ncbi:MAG TPA: hypothetical protein VGB13_05620, partial [Candidatus Krumholzibacteria bacterium]
MEGFDVIEYPEGMPCWAPGAADYLASILTGREACNEWGGGASTVWLANKVAYIYVLETDPKWGKWIEDRTRDHVCVHYMKVSDPKYLYPVISSLPMVYLIDGYRRIDCLAVVEKSASPGDIVVLDDALDYAEHLLDGPHKIRRFAQPHP